MPGNSLCLKPAFSPEPSFEGTLASLKDAPLFTENMPPASATLWHLYFSFLLVNLTWFEFSGAPLGTVKIAFCVRSSRLVVSIRTTTMSVHVCMFSRGRWGLELASLLFLFLVDDSLVLATGQWTHHVTSWVTVLFPNKGRPGWNWHSPSSRAQRGPLKLKRIRCRLVWECVSGRCCVSAPALVFFLWPCVKWAFLASDSAALGCPESRIYLLISSK